jgi:hypothetical protein
MARFVAAFEALPPAQREAFVMKEEAGLSIAEIAAATGAGEDAVKSRVRYATAKLRGPRWLIRATTRWRRLPRPAAARAAARARRRDPRGRTAGGGTKPASTTGAGPFRVHRRRARALHQRRAASGAAMVVDGAGRGSAEYPVAQAPAEPPAKAEAPMAEAVAKPAPPASRKPDSGAIRDEARAAFPAQAPERIAPPAPAAPAANEVAPRFAPAPAAAAAKAPAPAAAPAPATTITAPPAAAPPPSRPAAMPRNRRLGPYRIVGAAPAAIRRTGKQNRGRGARRYHCARRDRLRRIAELRGRPACKADEALAHQRDHPDFIIAPALWEKVRAR